MSTCVIALAQSYNMPLEKFAKELKERNGYEEVAASILHEKIIDFLQDNARIEDVAAQV